MSTTAPETTDTPTTKSMEDIVALCKRRGFIFPASEIYGGINGFWDFGPLGVELKNNLRDAWWHDMVRCPPTGPDGELLTIVGLDSAIIQNPKVWEASGHVAGFNDPMVDCRKCKSRFRADHLKLCMAIRVTDAPSELADASQMQDLVVQPKEVHYWTCEIDGTGIAIGGASLDEAIGPVPHLLKQVRYQQPDRGAYWVAESWGKLWLLQRAPTLDTAPLECPKCGAKGSFTDARQFNLMFASYAGALQDDAHKVYLRPETAQGIFVNQKNVLDTMRVKVPFGIAQVGKAFRNEVTPRNFIYRSREFEQMEMEWFCHPDEAAKWFAFWQLERLAWWKSLGICDDNLKLRQHDADELSHYAKGGAGTVDIEYRFPFTHPGFAELEGIAHRTDFDLKAHQEHAKVKLEYFDQERNTRYIPHVVEPAAGLSRGVLVLLCEAYTPDPERPSKVYMKFHPRMAPIKAAIFPLVAKDGMPEVAQKVYDALRTKYAVQFDVKQNIGKRYARMDEAGTPYCFTIDGQTLDDQTVTVRERDTLRQERINIAQVGSYLTDRIGG